MMTWADTNLDLVLFVFEAKEATGLITAARIGVTVSGDGGTKPSSFDFPGWSGSTVKDGEFLEDPASSSEGKSCCRNMFVKQEQRPAFREPLAALSALPALRQAYPNNSAA
jgi:hypothetical protein